MMYYDQFDTGKRIQKLRRERYLTQEELAIKLNISDRHSAVWREGNIHHPLICLLKLLLSLM